MSLEAETLENGIRLIRLAGRLDMKNTLMIDASFTALAAGPGRVVVDMSAVNFLSSIGMRLLLSNAKSLASQGDQLVLFGLQPMVLEVMQVAGLDDLIPVRASLEEAIS